MTTRFCCAALLATTMLGTTMSCAARAAADRPFRLDQTPGLLPTDIVPDAYRIAIDVDMARHALGGHEEIEIAAARPAAEVVLQQAGLAVSRAEIDGAPAAVSEDQGRQTLTLRPGRPLAAGQHTLSVSWTGPIPTTPAGIYDDEYRAPDGRRDRMLVTQFEVADARRMFPGWDEPAFKATFSLSATLPADWVALSNMPAASREAAGPGRQRVTFATTPRMSTYLLALVGGHLAPLAGSGGGTPIRVWAPRGEQGRGRVALDAADKILPYYNSYFGVRYPLPKLDLIAVPENYAAGAMENWGAITFIDDSLLFDPATSAPATRETIYLDVSHEMAHQWSGDLVTMGWWNDIWLNEGFATWMETKATDHFNPGWQIWPRQHGDRERAMAVDAKSTTHAIDHPIGSVSEADAAFDLIDYQKGEQVIRMIEAWLGPDVFRDGMRRYMKAHAYGSTTSADLWAALRAASGQDVAAVAAGFTDQPGIPLVHVSRACRGGASVLSLRESRFTIHDPDAAALSWTIPVTVGPAPGAAVEADAGGADAGGGSGAGGRARTVLLGPAGATLRFAGCGEALKANLGENGYYRTIYDAAAFAPLARGFARFGAADRADLLGDQYALFEAGDAPLSAYLGLVSRLAAEHESSVAVWEDTISHLQAIDSLLRGSPARDRFRVFACAVLRPEFARLGWEPKPGESFLATLLRPELITALGRLEDPAVSAEARRRFAAWRRDPASLPASLVGPVALVVGEHADPATWEVLAGLVRRAPDTEQKLRFFDAAAATHDPSLLRRAVALAASGVIPDGRIGFELRRAAILSDRPDDVFALVRADEAQVSAHLTGGEVANLLPDTAAGSSDTATAAALLADPASHGSDGARIEAEKAADNIRTRAVLAGRAAGAVSAWLSGRPA